MVSRRQLTIKSITVRLLVSFVSVTVGLIAVELLIRLNGIDHRLMVRAIFFQAADIPVHRISMDPFLHYELKPGADYHGTFPGKPPYEVQIDQNGARFPPHPAMKAPDTFRILGFGGSTLYGGAVSDSDTIAAAMERRLNLDGAKRTTPIHFEVWNFGTSAYTLGQATHLARAKLSLLSPDLILVQHHNRGRRGFLMPENKDPDSYPRDTLDSDPYLYQEQFHVPKPLSRAMHQRLMTHVAFYRSIVAVLTLIVRDDDDYCDRLSAREARSLGREAAATGVPIVYFAIPADRGGFGPETVFPGLAAHEYIDLYRPDRDAAFYEVHPPPATLDDFAALLIEELKARHFLPAA